MGEWQAWHPTVSRPSRLTDITDGFGPGTRWSAGPESYIDEVVAASQVATGRSGSRCLLDLVNLSWCLRAWLRRWCSGCRRARPPARRPRREPAARRVVSKPGQALRSRRHPPHRWRGVRRGRPGPAAALRHPECTSARRHPPHWWRGCVVGGQARTWRIHGLGAELPCTRRRVRKM